ncbi:hypothetical protein [Mycolicibacterium fortuitum]|uniref:hypothetical protein n=1 Tax=Mycolicibacterium fortuitum TaxID=1766 RepID=UPI001055D390|nr:hypothetical protein [Mycolicibacterium fortuitum]
MELTVGQPLELVAGEFAGPEGNFRWNPLMLAITLPSNWTPSLHSMDLHQLLREQTPILSAHLNIECRVGVRLYTDRTRQAEDCDKRDQCDARQIVGGGHGLRHRMGR